MGNGNVGRKPLGAAIGKSREGLRRLEGNFHNQNQSKWGVRENKRYLERVHGKYKRRKEKSFVKVEQAEILKRELEQKKKMGDFNGEKEGLGPLP